MTELRFKRREYFQVLSGETLQGSTCGLKVSKLLGAGLGCEGAPARADES